MKIQLNGKPADLPDDATLLDLLATMQLSGRRVAIEINGEIVPRSEHASRRPADGDRIEVVHAIGGGQPDTDN